MNNYQKNEKYSELMLGLNKSIKNEFYYESIFISYAILEDRTESLLRHARLKTKDPNQQTLTLNQKINKIKQSAIFKDKYIEKHLTQELIFEISNWKSKRNKLIHDLIHSPYSNNEIKKIALEGYNLVKRMNNKSTLVNKYLDKNNGCINK